MVYLVDDDDAVRRSLTMLLEAAGYSIASFPDARSFLESRTSDMSGCVILDLSMPGMDGLSLQRELTRRGSRLPIIFLSSYGTIPSTVRAIKGGALDFLTKPVEGSVLLAHIEEALETWQKQADKDQSAKELLAKLTRRELEIMAQLVEGHTSKEIGRLLDISYRTVEIHRANIMKKTGATNPFELASISNRLRETLHAA